MHLPYPLRKLRRWWTNRDVAPQITRQLRRMVRSDKPIVVGPWLSEVGFELLYWVPFVTWAVETYGFAPERLVIVSRGGVEPWYRHLGGRYVEMFDHIPVDEFRDLNALRTGGAGQKHMKFGEADRAILQRLGLADGAEVLHPSLLYRLLKPLWQRRATPRLASAYARYVGMAPPPRPAHAALPPAYVCAKFYGSNALPDTPANREAVLRIIESLSESLPVVLLRNVNVYDDHLDLAVAAGGNRNVIEFRPSGDATNLGEQTAVVAGASFFIGTYGGFSYLPPLMGIPAVGLFSEPGRIIPGHVDVANRVFREFRTGQFDRNTPPGLHGPLPDARFTVIAIESALDLMPQTRGAGAARGVP
jgi:hypothetical protein